MQLSISDDQAAVLGALDSLAKPFAATPTNFRGFTLVSADLDRALAEGGFLDVAYESDLGAVAAALVVMQLARLPYATEVAASALVRPLLGAELPRPICLTDAATPHLPIRFLAPGASVIVLDRNGVSGFTACAQDVQPAETLFGYPIAMLAPRGDRETMSRRFDVSPVTVRAAWRVALAAEIAGLLGAAIDATVLYVSDRKQFGRPIGSFQAVRHRLAEASVRAMATRWLALQAAGSGDPGDAALAAQYAQESAAGVVYDLHQFLGAMGVTLEHPLHLWTYRLKALLSDLGGRSAHAVDAAALIWDDGGADP